MTENRVLATFWRKVEQCVCSPELTKSKRRSQRPFAGLHPVFCSRVPPVQMGRRSLRDRDFVSGLPVSYLSRRRLLIEASSAVIR